MKEYKKKQAEQLDGGGEALPAVVVKTITFFEIEYDF